MKYIAFSLCLLLTVAVFTSADSDSEQCPCVAAEYIAKRRPAYLQTGIQEYQLATTRATYNWPFKPFGKAFPVGHACHSYQNYGGQPYFHHGVDMRVPSATNIYSSTGGTVVNIENYVPGNHLYWEIAIRDDEGFLWQYHHVDRATIPQEIYTAYNTGNPIPSGTFIGKVVYWPATAYGMNFHHIHVNVLDGNGNFLNPLLFLIRPEDSTPPRIHNVYFVNNNSNSAISPNSLRGDIDIIVRAEDLMDNQPYQLTIHHLEYEIQSTKGPHKLPRTTLWKFDTLPGGSSIHDHVHTVLKSSFTANGQTLRTSGNYNRREFYFVATNNKNGKIDSNGTWSTSAKDTKGEALFPNGTYDIVIHATDFNGNTTSKTVQVTVNN